MNRDACATCGAYSCTNYFCTQQRDQILFEIDGWAESLSLYNWNMEQQRKQLVRDASHYAGKSHFDMIADTYRTMDRIGEKIREIRARMDGLQARLS